VERRKEKRKWEVIGENKCKKGKSQDKRSITEVENNMMQGHYRSRKQHVATGVKNILEGGDIILG
jgi:hypothetical protein